MINNHKLFNVFFYLLLISSIIPFIVLSFYTLPNLEDYAESLIPNVWFHIKFLYLTYDGRFFVSFLFAALNPLKHHSILAYQMLPILLILLLFFSLRFLFKQLISNKYSFVSTFVAGIVLLMFLESNPNMPYTFYYMISSYIYTLPLIYFLLTIVFLIKLSVAHTSTLKISYTILLCLLIFAIMGSNELLIGPLLLVLLVFFIVSIKTNKNLNLEFSLIFLSFICAAFVVFTSPGIYQYFEESGQSTSLEIFFQSFTTATLYAARLFYEKVIINYTLWFTSIFFILVLYQSNSKLLISLKTKDYLVMAILFVPCYFLMLVPYTYSAGPKASYHYSQVLIIPYFFLICFWIFSLLFIAQILAKKKPAVNIFQLMPNYLYLIILCLFLLFDKKSKINVAYNDLFSGKAAKYYAEVKSNIPINNQSTLTVNCLTAKPSTIFSGVYFNAENENFHLEYKMYYNLHEIQVKNCQ